MCPPRLVKKLANFTRVWSYEQHACLELENSVAKSCVRSDFLNMAKTIIQWQMIYYFCKNVELFQLIFFRHFFLFLQENFTFKVNKSIYLDQTYLVCSIPDWKLIILIDEGTCVIYSQLLIEIIALIRKWLVSQVGKIIV